MNDTRVARVPAGRLALGVALAILMGVALPMLTVMQLTIMIPLAIPVLLVGGIWMAFLHGHSGWVSVGAFMAALLLGGDALKLMIERTGWVPSSMLGAMVLGAAAACTGPEMLLVKLLLAVLPGIVVIAGMMRKRPFFSQLRMGIGAFVAGMLGCVIIAYRAFGGDMIGKLMDMVRAQFDAVPDYVILPLIEALNQSIAQTGAGLGRITIADYRSIFSGALDQMQLAYMEYAPGMLLAGAIWSGVLAVLWGNWRMAKRGIASVESFVGMSQWYLPGQMTLGLLGISAISFIAATSGSTSWTTVLNTCTALTGTAFTVQALASFDRRFIMRGTQTGGRKVRLTLILLLSWAFNLIGLVTAAFGAASALFGSRGVITAWKNKMKDESDHDDFDM